jgi:Na+-translocating ferredoxin:NAD+ oxidoreductase RnfD subunit
VSALWVFVALSWRFRCVVLSLSCVLLGFRLDDVGVVVVFSWQFRGYHVSFVAISWLILGLWLALFIVVSWQIPCIFLAKFLSCRYSVLAVFEVLFPRRCL